MSNIANQYEKRDSPVYYNFLYCFRYSQLCKNQNKNVNFIFIHYIFNIS